MRRRRAADLRPVARLLDLGLVLVAALGTVVVLARIVGAVLGLELVAFATGSMTPAFPQGAVAIAQHVPLDQVRVGDVVTVDRPGDLPITHRVVAVGMSGGTAVLQLKGDANRHVDPVPYRTDHLSRIVLPLAPTLWSLRLVGAPWLTGSAALLAALAVVWALWPRSSARPVTA